MLVGTMATDFTIAHPLTDEVPRHPTFLDLVSIGHKYYERLDNSWRDRYDRFSPFVCSANTITPFTQAVSGTSKFIMVYHGIMNVYGIQPSSANPEEFEESGDFLSRARYNLSPECRRGVALAGQSIVFPMLMI